MVQASSLLYKDSSDLNHVPQLLPFMYRSETHAVEVARTTTTVPAGPAEVSRLKEPSRTIQAAPWMIPATNFLQLSVKMCTCLIELSCQKLLRPVYC